MKTWQLLFDITVVHNYYTEGKCPDFEIIPDAECEQFLKGHRLVWKSTPYGLQLMIPVDERGQTPVQSSGQKVFSFDLRLKNEDFLHFTELPGWDATQAYLFTNGERDSNTESEILHRALQSRNEMKLSKDVGHFGKVAIRITEWERAISQAWSYRLRFEAKEEQWHYCIVASRDFEQLGIEEEAGQQSAVKFNEIDLAAVPSTSKVYPVVQRLPALFPDASCHLFESEDSIVYSEEPKGNIQLHYTRPPDPSDPTTNDKDVLIEHLLNPHARQQGIAIIKI